MQNKQQTKKIRFWHFLWISHTVHHDPENYLPEKKNILKVVSFIHYEENGKYHGNASLRLVFWNFKACYVDQIWQRVKENVRIHWIVANVLSQLLEMLAISKIKFIGDEFYLEYISLNNQHNTLEAFSCGH